MPKFARVLLAVVVAVVAAGLAGCADDEGELVLHAGGEEQLLRPLLDRFTAETGVRVRARFGDNADLASELLDEDAATDADVFLSQDAAALAALADRGRLSELPRDLVEPVDRRFRDPDRRWVGISARARVVAYNVARVPAAERPESVFALTDQRWRGRVAIVPRDTSFVAWVGGLSEQFGRDRVAAWLAALKANDAKRFDSEAAALRAIAEGAVDVAWVDHAALAALLEPEQSTAVANHVPGQKADGEGTFVNVTGIAVIDGSDRADDVRRLVSFLLGADAQEHLRTQTGEYPLAAGARQSLDLPPLAGLRLFDVPLDRLGRDPDAGRHLLEEAGLG